MEQTFPDYIHAAIDPGAISKVSRFFDASTEQVVSELLQNARRANATRVAVRTGDGTLRISDDGDGIANPTAVLAFGRSGWSPATVSAEDPAGMGIFSLARRGGVIISRPRGRDVDARGWRVELEPEHFVGDAGAAVSEGEDAPRPHGTHVEFGVSEGSHALRQMIKEAGRHFPLPITLDGEEIERDEFLGKAVRIEEWEGVRIGVMHSPYASWTRGRINFHGHIIECSQLATISALPESGNRVDTWWTLVDVVDRSGLELVLPARAQVVHNAYLKELAEQSEAAIYRTIAENGTDAVLGHDVWRRSMELGVKLPPARPRLRNWRPRVAEDWNNGRGESDVWNELPAEGGSALLMAARMSIADEHVLDRALKRARMRYRVFAADDRLAGYSWCRSLRRIEDAHVVVHAGKAFDLREARREKTPAPDGRVERIEIVLSIIDADGKCEEMRLDTDVAFWSVEPATAEEIELTLTDKAVVDAEEVANMMTDSFFYPREEVDSESPLMQRAAYLRQSRELTLELTESEAAARTETVRDLIKAYVMREIGQDEEVHVHIAPGHELRVFVEERGKAA